MCEDAKVTIRSEMSQIFSIAQKQEDVEVMLTNSCLLFEGSASELFGTDAKV